MFLRLREYDPSAYPDPAFVIVPAKPGTVKSAVATTAGFVPPVN